MNDAVIAASSESPLCRLLAEYFGREALQALLGSEAADLDEATWTKALRGPVADFLARPGKEFRASLVTTAYSSVRASKSVWRSASTLRTRSAVQ